MKENLELTHFKGHSMKPINLSFKKRNDVIRYLNLLIFNEKGEKIINNHDTVYLMTCRFNYMEDFETLIYIEKTPAMFCAYLSLIFISDQNAPVTEIHIQEYVSYEDVYSVALDMREGDKICYNEKK
jgi:hypothetical protein